MNKKILILLFITLLLFPIQLKGESYEDAYKELITTLDLINEAYSYGADSNQIKDLINKLNNALSLLEEAKIYEKENKTLEANYKIQQAMQIIKEVKIEAENILNSAKQENINIKILAYSSAPIIAFILTFISFKIYSILRFWKINKIKKLMVKLNEIKEDEE